MTQKRYLLAMLCAGMIALAGNAQADPLLPNLGNIDIVGSIAGQSTLLSPTRTIYLDWMIFKPGNWNFVSGLTVDGDSPGSPSASSEYLYAFQLENPSNKYLYRATLAGIPTGTVASFGWAASQDLDDPSWNHNSGTYGNLATENEGFTQVNLVKNATLEFEPDADKISWEFSTSLKTNEESDILFFTSLAKPSYSEMLAMNGDIFRGPAPVPVPEPGTLLILGSVFGGFIASKRKKA